MFRWIFKVGIGSEIHLTTEIWENHQEKKTCNKIYLVDGQLLNFWED